MLQVILFFIFSDKKHRDWLKEIPLSSSAYSYYKPGMVDNSCYRTIGMAPLSVPKMVNMTEFLALS